MVQAQVLPQTLTEKDFLNFSNEQTKLGQLLFYDKILSGNSNISCATCHHPDHGTGDGLSLGIGEGGVGLGPKRIIGDDVIKKRIPRNSSALWNLGAKKINVLFHDGRISQKNTYGNKFDSPAEEWLPLGFNSILAAQAVFPLVSQFEMAGNPGENDVAGAAHDRIDAPWPIIAKRVRSITQYGDRFINAFEHINTASEVSIVDIANALAAFMTMEWKSIDSNFDDYLSGNLDVLSETEIAGMNLFYGKAGCSVCHSGKLLTDQKFHALGLPSFGPGRTRIFDPIPRDVGHMAETDKIIDAYSFRTPMLRNVVLTAPYGHNGAYSTLEGIIKHHVDPNGAKNKWSNSDLLLPKIPHLKLTDFIIQEDIREMKRQSNSISIIPVKVSELEIKQLIAFMGALTGKSLERLGVPLSVPSGLSVD
jgi:cytochrome c peroxidase|tara:strand:- start:41328 stop:42590 length:1263 start_codon:yes stop_codon:yes gene_type:complete